MRPILQVVIFFLFFYGSSQEKNLKKGEVIDSIEVTGELNETFALYLPKQFDSSKLSAVVFIFDPAARGKIGIKPFIASAEKYNYILVCSNNTKNGPFGPNFEIINHLFDYFFSNFHIDEKRIYTSGFSGGARLATTIGILTGAVQGVIGCGAGFPGYPYNPTSEIKFSYAGLVGDRDMNYQEMVRLNKRLDSLSIKNELFVYEDDHNWPPSEQLLKAFDWLELQAYKKGIKPNDDEVVKAIFLDNYSIADTLEKNNKISFAVQEYERITRNYSSYFELDSIVAKTKKLKKLKSYKEELKGQKRVASLEGALHSKFREKFNAEVRLGKNEDDFKWWKKELKKLDETYVDNEQNYLQKMGKRIRYQLFAMVYESSNGYVQSKDFEKALYCDLLLTIQQLDNPYVQYRVAQGYARMNNLEKMLEHLESAMQLGLKDKEFIRKTKEFSAFANNESFKKLMEKY